MQDRYAGDVGDFGKFKLLQELQREGFTLGVNWYRAEPPASEKDPKTGKFLWQDGKYRIRPQDRQLDPKLADALEQIAAGCRSVGRLERAGLLDEGKTVYYDETVPVQGREAWHQKAVEKLSLCDLIFLDPDNGLKPKRTTRARLVKYVRETELEDYLARGQNVVLYQHRPRKKDELWFRQLRMKLAGLSSAQGKQVFTLTCCRGTLRDYLIIAATAKDAARIRQALKRIIQSPWGTSGFCRQSAFPDLD